MASIEKREDGWYADGSGPFTSRDAARQAVKSADQEAAFDTYAGNIAATEALDAAEDAEAAALVQGATDEFDHVQGFDTELTELDTRVTRETAAQVRERENIVYMAIYANSEPARAYWRRLADEKGYEVPVMDATS